MLKVRWGIQAAEKNWDAALGIATSLVQLEPGDPFGWVCRSCTLQQLNRTLEARDNLSRVVENFPANVTIQYDLARYECQLGNLEAAGDYLSKAFNVSGKHELKVQALGDADLKPLWRDHGITQSGQVRAKPVDLSAPSRRRSVNNFFLALLFWVAASAGVAWRDGAKTRVDFSDAGLTGAGLLFGLSFFLLIFVWPEIVLLIKRQPLHPASPLSKLTRFTIANVMASVTGAIVASFCRPRMANFGGKWVVPKALLTSAPPWAGRKE